jgi:hypothetical protein
MADDKPDDGLTPEERKFMETRGLSGLPDPTEQPAAPPAADEPAVPAAAEAPAGESPPAGAAPPDDEEEGEPPVDPKTGKKPPRHVNYNRFRKLQEQYDEQTRQFELTRNEMTQLKDTVSRADERMRIINEALTAPTEEQQNAEAEDPAPDPKEDIFGYVAWQGRQMQRMQERLGEQIEGIRDHVGTQTAENELVNNYRADAARYAATQPLFGAAYGHLIRTRLAQLEAAGVDALLDRERIVLQEERALVEQSYASRINPAERIFRVAQAYGFNPNVAANAPVAATTAVGSPPPTAPSAAPTTPHPGAGAATTPPPPNVGAEIEAVRSGQAASFSLSQAGGAPPETLTPEILANMDEEAFGKLMDRLSPARLRQLLPGA